MGNEGFKYEDNLYQNYKAMGWVPKTFVPAGSNPNAPDIIIISPNSNRIAVVEVKAEGETKDLDKLDYGQAGIVQDPTTKKWSWSPRGSSHPASVYLRNALTQQGILEKINSHWKGLSSAVLMEGNTAKNRRLDREQFRGTEVNFKISNDIVRNYYAMKGVDYIQIKYRGCYVIGRDVYGLGLPRFIPTELFCVARRKGSRFTTALRIGGYPSTKLSMDNRQEFTQAILNAEQSKR